MTAGLLDEINEFLHGLSREFPRLFQPAPPARETPGQRGMARAVFGERVAYWSEKMGARYNRVQIKDQKTLWGSCSRLGNLNFNWRLILAPPEVLDYLVIHELAHLKEMNHSRRFWRHVEIWCPDHRSRRRWLRDHGRELQKATGGPVGGTDASASNKSELFGLKTYRVEARRS